MITYIVLKTIAGVFEGILSILPTSGSNYGFGTAYTSIDQSLFFQHFAWANNYFPITDAVHAITLLLTIFLVMYIIRIILWIWELIKP